MSLHEYSVYEHSRATLGRYLIVTAGLIAWLISGLVLGLWRLGSTYGYLPAPPETFILVLLPAAIYPMLYWIFDYYLWKMPGLSTLVGVPNISGKWECAGLTVSNNGDGSKPGEWHGVVTITQNWDKIKIFLITDNSISESISASLVKEPGLGVKLMYSYENRPKTAACNLAKHTGYSELLFNPEFTSAEGGYFNNMGRITHGSMKLTKVTSA